jgi:hypothetical protein
VVLSRHALAVAGVSISLSIDDYLPGLSPQFEPFRTRIDPLLPVDIDLEIVHEDTSEASLVAVPPGQMFMSVHRQQANLMFCREEGRLLADAGFASCRAWDVRAFAPPETFDGRPWLLLAIWGYLAHRAGALLHGAVCELEGHFVIFLGRPGVGKSTLGRLVVEAGGTCVTEEYPLLTCPDGLAWAHGTPWRGIQGAGRRLSGPLEGVFFLRHAPANDLRRLDQREGGQRLLENARFFIWEPTTVPETVEMLDRTARHTPIYDFGFVADLSAVEHLREVL